MQRRPNEPKDPVLEAVIESFRVLQAAVGNARLYASDHPEADRPLYSFIEKLHLITARHGPIRVSTGFEGLRWKKKTVSTESEEQKGLGQFLHREGITEMTFMPGLEVPEARRMMNAMRVNFSMPEFEEETLESLLWAARLKHVQFMSASSLMDAEARSGRAEDDAVEVDNKLQEFLADIVAGPAEDEPRKNFNQLVDEHHIRQAIRDHELVIEAEDDLDMEYDDRFWNEYLAVVEEGDDQKLEEIRRSLGQETEAGVLLRGFRVLLRAGLVGRSELDIQTALKYSDAVIKRMYTVGTVSSALKVVEDGRRVLGTIPRNSPHRPMLQTFYKENALPPFRVAGLMVNLDYGDAAEVTAAELVAVDAVWQRWKGCFPHLLNVVPRTE